MSHVIAHLHEQFHLKALESGIQLDTQIPEDLALLLDENDSELQSTLEILIAYSLKCATPGSKVHIILHDLMNKMELEIRFVSSVGYDFFKTLLDTRLELIEQHRSLQVHTHGDNTSLLISLEKKTR